MNKMLVDILDNDFEVPKTILPPFEVDYNNFEFFNIKEITFEEEAPRREALENVLGSLRLDGVNFIYLIMGNKNGISFYFGVGQNKEKLDIDINDIAKQILKANIEGNFRGSSVKRLTRTKRSSLQDELKKFKYIVEVDGIPDINEEAEKFQGIDRLVDIMSISSDYKEEGEEQKFALMIISSTISVDEIMDIEKSLYKIYDKLSPFVKKTMQKTSSTAQSTAISIAENSSNSKSVANVYTEGENKNTTTSDQKTTTTSNTEEIDDNVSRNSSKQKSQSSQTTIIKNDNTTTTTTTNEGLSKSETKNNTKNETLNETENIEFTKKHIEEWLKYIDEILLKRVNYAKGKGAFKTGIYLLANTKGKIKKFGNSFVSLFSGIKENKVPLHYSFVEDFLHKRAVYNFQLPKYKINQNENYNYKMLLYSKINEVEWLSTKELSIIASLPQKEVVGLRLKEEIEFGLNTPENKDGLNLGKLVKSGQILDIDVNLDKNELNKHIFIAGVTGSGKTTTCHKILYSSNMPFLVIEPAKTEYRVLTNRDDVLVFTVGNENISPFRINPFEFMKGENISSRVDMIKASIESSFHMEAAMPQIIESAIYRAYEEKGWDISTSTNFLFDDPFEKGVKSFPLLEDVIRTVEDVVKEQEFGDELHQNYLGSIKARLKGLMIGSKRFTLNTSRSFDFKSLLDKKVVIELEEIKNPSEKSFIMGLILINLNEALKVKYKENNKFKHITLIEEAHRLLSKFESGDSMNKKSGVEAFSDMLAEVRKYGESLIIVDQIPNKLTSEVLKNTNTKIVHRIFARDDKEAIGNTMALNEDQKEFLSKLDVGKAIVFNQNYYNSIQVKIIALDNISTTTTKDIAVETLRKKWLRYYKEENNFNFTNYEIENLLKLESLFGSSFEERKKNSNKSKLLMNNYKNRIQKLLQETNIDLKKVVRFIKLRFIQDNSLSDNELKELFENLKEKGRIETIYQKMYKRS